MNILNIYSNFLQTRRFLQIVRILLRHGYKNWYLNTKMGKRHLRRHPEVKYLSTPERIRVLIEDLGPTFVKFGQILADRPDVIAERFRVELKKLQSQVDPIDNQTAWHLIENELCKSIRQVFKSINKKCIASASIGQVYEATLKNGEEVIIKIQRPHIEKTIKLDIKLMRWMVNRFIKEYPQYSYMDLAGFVEEFSKQMANELDYFNEADNMSRFAGMFEDNPKVYIPKVYSEYTTKRLLVMEKINGLPPDHIKDLKAAGYDLHEIAVTGANALLKMIMEEGFFHADPHPGNIFIMPGNVVCFIDFGMVGSLRPREMNFIANFLISFVRKNPKAMGSALLSLSGKQFYQDMDELEFELDSLLKRVGNVPVEEINFASLMQSCINILVKHQLRVPSGMFMLGKSLLTLQRFAGELDPDLPITPLVLPYAKRLVSNQYNVSRLAGSVFDTLWDYINMARSLPVQVNEILYKLKEGKISHEIKVDDASSMNRAFRNAANRIVLAILLMALFVGSALLTALAPEIIYGKILLIASSAIILIMLLGRIFRKRY